MCAILEICPVIKSNQHFYVQREVQAMAATPRVPCQSTGEVGRSVSHWCECIEDVSNVESFSAHQQLEKDLTSLYFQHPWNEKEAW